LPVWENTHRELETMLGGDEPARLRKNLQTLL
jgi:hypothetical protein